MYKLKQINPEYAFEITDEAFTALAPDVQVLYSREREECHDQYFDVNCNNDFGPITQVLANEERFMQPEDRPDRWEDENSDGGFDTNNF